MTENALFKGRTVRAEFPVRIYGKIVGSAYLLADGEVIIDPITYFQHNNQDDVLFAFLQCGLSNGIDLKVNLIPAVPVREGFENGH